MCRKLSMSVSLLGISNMTSCSYIVVVKVGKPTERTKPGNRGKRDSQILVMQYLNRVHFDSPMTPLELEIYHQMRNVIGIDPAFYEYIFTVDADTVSYSNGQLTRSALTNVLDGYPGFRESLGCVCCR